MSKQNKIILHCIWITLLIPLLAKAQGFAGPDRSICTEGSTKLGGTSTCNDCCYLWSPETGLDDPSKPNPTVSELTKTQNYTVYISYPDGHYESDDVNVTVYDSDLQIFHPNYFKINTLIPENEEKVPGAQSYVNLDNDDCDQDFDIDDVIIEGGDNEFIKMRVIMTILQYNKPGSGGNNPDNGPSEYEAALDLAQGTEVSGLRFWKSNDKAAGEYFIGNPLVLTAVNGFPNMYETYIWAEGTEAHTIQQQVKLFARAYDDLEPACTDKFVTITIVGIEKIEWVGKENGYTKAKEPGKDPGINNSNTLDEVDGSFRVFPELKETVKGATVKTSVSVKITLSVAPPVKQDLFVRPFDIDDPSYDKTFVDPNDTGTSGNYAGSAAPSSALTYTKENDNRGFALPNTSSNVTSNSSGQKEGVITGPNITVAITSTATIYTIPDVLTKEVLIENFWVSQMCGDNYKIAANHDKIFLTNTRNEDAGDQDRIVDKCTGDPGKGKEISKNLYSPILTVWRTLHIEYDMMENPSGTSFLSKNLGFTGVFTNFDDENLNFTDKIQGIKCDGPCPPNILIGAQPLRDLSKLSTNGRFEGGGIKIGKPGQVFCDPSVNKGGNGGSSFIVKNTHNELHLSTQMDLTMKATLEGTLKRTDGTLPINFNIFNISLSGEEFKITMKKKIDNLNDYANGSISIGGGNTFLNSVIIITGNNQEFKIPKASLAIPIEIIDDDLPWTGAASPGITPVSFDHPQKVYESVYIDVKVNGGGTITNNESNIQFIPNLKQKIINNAAGTPIDEDVFTQEQAFIINNNKNIRQTRDDGSPNFWMLYVLSAWQRTTNPDSDPYSEEFAPFGAAMDAKVDDCLLTDGGDMVALFHAIAAESLAGGLKLSNALSHEIGHCLGLSHGNNHTYTNNDLYDNGKEIINNCLTEISTFSGMKIMTPVSSNNEVKFIYYHENLIRSRVESPTHH